MSDLNMIDEGMVRVEVPEWWTTYVMDPYYDAPDHGDTVDYGDMRPVSPSAAGDRYAVAGGYWYSVDPEAPRYVEIPSTGHSGLDAGHGDFINVSNYERILEDYSEHVVDARNGGYGSAALYLRVGGLVPEDLMDAVNGLEDYPLYDEEDHSRREQEALQEWAEIVIDSVVRTLEIEREDLDPDVIRANGEEVLGWVLEEGEVYRSEDLREDALEDRLRAHLTDLYPGKE